LIAKIAFPFVCVIMGMMGTGLPLSRKRGDGLAGSVFYGIGLAFIYWTLYSFCLSLGYGKILPPLVAAWVTNVVFFFIGAFIFLKAA
jgi:lipopolysaccharide export system permease protein